MVCSTKKVQVSGLVPNIHFIIVNTYEWNDLQMYQFMGQYLIHHMATVIFSNLLRVGEFKIVSNVYIMGSPHLLKVRWKGKMH